MFNSLSSFLFSTVPSQDILTRSTNSIYDTQELDGDWLLVDRIDSDPEVVCSVLDGPPSSGLPQVEEEDVEEDIVALRAARLSLHVPLGPLENQITPPSSPSSLQMMDGSWYVTPPPCFTAGSPAYLETSPLENLLIEHPSMSVYGPVSNFSFLNMRRSESPSSECSRHRSLESAKSELSCEETENSCPLARRENNHRVVGRRHQQFTRALAATLDAVEIEERLLSLKGQKVQYRRDQRKLKTSTMERQNRNRLSKSCKGNSQPKNAYLMQPTKSKKC